MGSLYSIDFAYISSDRFISLYRSPLPLGEQLCWALQLWTFHTLPILRGLCDDLPRHNARHAYVGYIGPKLLGQFIFIWILLATDEPCLVFANWQEGPDTLEFMMVIMNFVIGVPVLLCVGGFRLVPPNENGLRTILTRFSLYHFYCMSSNSTTIEGWEEG